MSVWWQFGASALVHALPSFASVPSVEMSPQWKSQHLNKVMKIVLMLQTLWKALRNPCPRGSADHTLRTSALASFPHLGVRPSSALQRSYLQWALAALSSPRQRSVGCPISPSSLVYNWLYPLSSSTTATKTTAYLLTCQTLFSELKTQSSRRQAKSLPSLSLYFRGRRRDNKLANKLHTR